MSEVPVKWAFQRVPEGFSFVDACTRMTVEKGKASGSLVPQWFLASATGSGDAKEPPPKTPHGARR
jgi:hypothetical protein